MCLAVPGEVVDIDATDPDNPTGRVDFGGVLRRVCLAYLPDARPGDFVIVHAGLAISLLDRAEAEAALDAFRHLDGPAP